MIMRDPTTWRWSHTRHHTDTLVVGRDPEIAVMRPARLAKLLVNYFGLVDAPAAFGLMFRHAAGGSPPTRPTTYPSLKGTRSTERPGFTWPSTSSPPGWPSGSAPGCRWC